MRRRRPTWWMVPSISTGMTKSGLLTGYNWKYTNTNPNFHQNQIPIESSHHFDQITSPAWWTMLSTLSVTPYSVLTVRSAKCWNLEWTILSHISCFVHGEVLGCQVVLDSLQPRYTSTFHWSCPVVQREKMLRSYLNYKLVFTDRMENTTRIPWTILGFYATSWT